MERCIGVLQPSYLPWLGYFEQIYRSDVFVLYDDVQYDKGSWRNRNRIKTPGGVQWLTVPVLTKGLGPLAVNEVRINTGVRWQQKHLRSLAQSYSRAEHYQRYAPGLQELLSKPWTSLCDLNIALIRHLCTALGIPDRFVLASELGIQGASSERLAAIVRHLRGSVFYEGAAGRNYIDADAFARHGVQVRFQDYVHPVYTQLHGEFAPYLSVVDLLMNHGPASLGVIVGNQPSWRTA